ncbi:MAG: ferritin-like domain-containing protein [Ferruginibacter sp.]
MKTAAKKTTSAAKKTSSSSKSKASSSAPKKSSSKAKSQSSDEIAHGLTDLFEDMLKDIYWAEKALTKAIPKMIKKATSELLSDALKSHLEETQNQILRCEQVFEIMGKKAQAKKCEAMDGLLKEAQEIMESTEEGPVRDAGIIAAGQKVEHYEIASYGTMCAFAKILGHHDIVELLEETLNEEKQADEKLTEVAESSINLDAADEDDEA